MSPLLPAVRSELTKILTLRSLTVYTAVLLLLSVLIQATSLRLFVDAVAAVLADPHRYDGMGRAGARLIRERYSVDVLDARVGELLGSTTAEPGD